MHKYFNIQVCISNIMPPKSFDPLTFEILNCILQCFWLDIIYRIDDKKYALSYSSQQRSSKNENHSVPCGPKH